MKGSDKSSYFHVCTDGNSLPWMFQDEKDFIAGVNRIAICYIKVKIKVIAYVLMDNHVHFLLYGTSTQCTTFINLYKRLTGRWILTRYGISGHMKLLPTEISKHPIKYSEKMSKNSSNRITGTKQ